MAVSPYALTDIESVKSYLKINILETNDDTLLEELINASSNQIEGYCKRQFKERTYTDEEYDGNGLKKFFLNQYPISSVSSITVDEITLGSTDYKVRKSNGELIHNSSWSEGDINILVSYTAGYSEIPSDLELACKHLVMSYFKSDVASFSTTFQDGFVFRPEALPAQVKALVAPYKKVM